MSAPHTIDGSFLALPLAALTESALTRAVVGLRGQVPGGDKGGRARRIDKEGHRVAKRVWPDVDL